MPASNKIQVGYIEAQDGAQFEIDAGTAAAPGLVFDDSAATGLYSPGTGQLAFSTSGKQTALRILADGKVGIDCSPTVALEVNGTIKASAFDGPITQTGDFTIDDWIVHAGDTNTKFGFSAADTFQVQAGGNSRLTVTSSGIDTTGEVTFATSSIMANGQFYRGIINSGSAEKIIGGYISGSDTLRLGETMYLTSTKLGINEDVPQGTIHVASTSNYSDVYLSNSTSGHTGSDGANIFLNNSLELGIWNKESTGVIRFATEGTEKMRITSGGSIKLPDDGKIEFGGAQDVAGDLQIYHAAGADSTIHHTATSGSTLRLRSRGFTFKNQANSQTIATLNEGDACKLFYSGGEKIATTGSGISVTGEVLTDQINLSAIDITSGLESPYDEAGTGETIFVYDTRNDADGGAWRKKCRHTSWYNEGSGTYRGTRKEFPAVAVIVLGQVRTTIYDADDPSMPLWMQFRSSSTGYMLGCNDDRPSCVTALNGVLYIGAKNVYGGFHIIDFINDTAKRVRGSETANGTNGWWPSGIAGRNGTNDSGGLWHEYDDAHRGYDNTAFGTLKSDDVWSIAVKALRGAPIDPITNLPIPTIAVGIDEGISIIKPEWHLGLNRSNTESYQHNDVSGHIVDINSNNSGYTLGRSVEWTDNDDLIFVMGDGNGDFDYIHTMDGDIKWDNTITVDTKTSNNNHHVRSMWRGNKSASAIYSNLLSRGSDWSTTWNTHQHKVNQVTAKKGYEFAARTRGGLNHIYENPEGDNGMIAYTTKSYTTGWLVGKEKMCVMASTDTTNLVGTDLAPNNCASAGPGRTEANSTTGWTNAGFVQWGSSSTRAFEGSYSIHATANSNGDYAYFTFPTTVGKKYTVSARLWVTHDSFTIKLGTAAGSGNEYFESPPIGTVAQWQMFTGSFQATATTSYFNLTESSTSQDSDGYIDSVIITEADPDHTNTHGFAGAGALNQGVNRGLQVYGTVTKQPVATGAELCSYSGWSTSNYLYQAYNPNLNHGSGDFAFYWWMNPNDSTSGKTIWSIADNKTLACGSGANDCSYLRAYFNDDDLRIDMSTNAFAYDPFQKGLQSHIQNRNSWMLCHIIRRGNTMELWVNGRREMVKIMNTGMWGNSPFTAYSELRIGHDSSTGSPDSSIEMALFRSSRSAPNKHQIEKMYKDELALFQENAKCTLVGTTNDHIEAMAYDKRSDILYVGAKGGRADFSGLVRINNNTTEVTRGVSASNDLVVEY